MNLLRRHVLALAGSLLALSATSAPADPAVPADAVKARLQSLGMEAITSSPQQMATHAAAGRAEWGRVIKTAVVKVD